MNGMEPQQAQQQQIQPHSNTPTQPSNTVSQINGTMDSN